MELGWLWFFAGAGALAFSIFAASMLNSWLLHRRERAAQRARDARAMATLVNLTLRGAPVTEADVQALLKQAERER